MDIETFLKEINEGLEAALTKKKEGEEAKTRMEKYADLRAQIEEDNEAIKEALGCDHRKQRGRTAPNMCCDECECEDEIDCYICELEAANEELVDENYQLKTLLIEVLKDIYLG